MDRKIIHRQFPSHKIFDSMKCNNEKDADGKCRRRRRACEIRSLISFLPLRLCRNQIVYLIFFVSIRYTEQRAEIALAVCVISTVSHSSSIWQSSDTEHDPIVHLLIPCAHEVVDYPNTRHVVLDAVQIDTGIAIKLVSMIRGRCLLKFTLSPGIRV